MLRCGVIGCGRIGCGFDDKPLRNIIRTHAMSYVKNKRTKLVSLCDIDQNKLKKYGRKYSIKSLYTNSQKMIETEQLDIVSICTLASTHFEVVKSAVKNYVKGIIIEKPISDSLINAEKIIQLCESNNIILAVNHQRRFDPFYHMVSGLIKNSELGKIQHVNVVYGGGISNTGSHLFDILRLFFGEAISVFAKYSKNKSTNKFDPNVDATIEFKNKIHCSLHALDSQNYGIAEMDIFGTKKRLHIDLVTNETKFYIKSKKTHDFNRLILSKKSIKKSRPATDIRLSIKNLAECSMKKRIPLCSGKDGYKSLELVVGSMISSNQNKKINFPIKYKNFKIKSR